MILPRFENISIERLSLYSDNVVQPILPGINMIIGGNGIGKTTFVQTVLFALLGNAEYQTQNAAGRVETVAVVPPDFFHGRITPEDEEHARATLKFRVGRTAVEVSRALFRPKLLKLKINGNTVSGAGDLEQKYRNRLVKLMNFDTFEHFVFVAANLLVFDEARRTLIWDPERQNRVIRLLFLTEFHGSLSQLSDKVTTLDTTSRHKSETRKDIRRNVARWVDAEKVSSVSGDASNQAKRLAVELTQLDESLEQTDNAISETESRISEETEHLHQLLALLDELEADKVVVAKALQRAEARFYKDIYESLPAQYLLILQTLAAQGTCQVCGASHAKLRKLGKKLKNNGECLVCRSPVAYSDNGQSSKDSDKLSAEINRLRKHLAELDEKQRGCAKAQAVANHQLATLQPRLSQLLKQKRLDEARIAKLQIQMEKLSGDDGSEAAWLRKQKEEIQKLTGEIDDLNKKRAVVLAKLKKVNDAFSKRLANVNENLTPLFSQFASKFLGVRCELVIGTMSKAKKPITYMFPRFDGKNRDSISEVSESQRFFIDQAFRMSLITLFSRLNHGATTFFVVETPEGSLDLAYERNVADMYLDFAKSGHSILVTSNLNSSNFLKGLYSHLGSSRAKSQRTLDLLQHGRLSDVQGDQATLQEFNNRKKELGLTSPH